MSSFFFDSRNPNPKKKKVGRDVPLDPADPNVTMEKTFVPMSDPNASSFMLSPTSSTAFDQLLKMNTGNPFSYVGGRAVMNPQAATTPPVAGSNVTTTAPGLSTPQLPANVQTLTSPIATQAPMPPVAPTPAPLAPTPTAPAPAPSVPSQPATPGALAAQVQNTDDAPTLITMLHELKSNSTSNSPNYPPEVVSAMTTLITQRLNAVNERERVRNRDEIRNRQATDRENENLKAKYPQWVSWMKTLPETGVGDDLSIEAFRQAMANPEAAKAFRGFLRLRGMKQGIQNQQGFGSGQNASDVLNTQRAGKDVNAFLGMIGDPNLGLPGEASTDALAAMQRPAVTAAPDQSAIAESLRSSDMGTQEAGLRALREQKSANEAARATPEYKKYESDYNKLQLLMRNMNLSPDAKMKIQRDVEKGLVTPGNAILNLMAAAAKPAAAR